MQKAEELERARLEVERYENQLEFIHSIHKEGDRTINWQELQFSPPPFTGSSGRENWKRLAGFKHSAPSFTQRLFKKADQAKDRLRIDISAAREQDFADYQNWKALKELASRVLADDSETICKSLKKRIILANHSNLGSVSFLAQRNLIIWMQSLIHRPSIQFPAGSRP